MGLSEENSLIVKLKYAELIFIWLPHPVQA